MHTAESVAEYLSGRAATYGGNLGDILLKTPECLWDNPDELMEFWSNKDLSHIFPQSTHPELAEIWGNIVPEDVAINRARGASVMTNDEVLSAELDAEIDAELIDLECTGDSAEFLYELLELAG